MKISANPKIFDSVIRKIVNDIEERQNDAGYSGSMSDNGAGHLQDQLDAFKAGLAGEWPPVFQQYVDDTSKEADPEYNEYLRLLKKFGGR